MTGEGRRGENIVEWNGVGQGREDMGGGSGVEWSGAGYVRVKGIWVG